MAITLAAPVARADAAVAPPAPSAGDDDATDRHAGFAIARRPLAATSETIEQAGLTTAVVWHFMQSLTTPVAAPAGAYALLRAHSQACEQLREFMAAPHGEGVYRAA